GVRGATQFFPLGNGLFSGTAFSAPVLAARQTSRHIQVVVISGAVAFCVGVIAIGAVIAVVIGSPVTIGVTVAHLPAHAATAGIWPALPGGEGNTFQCDPTGQRGHIRFPILLIIAGNNGQNFLVVIG